MVATYAPSASPPAIVFSAVGAGALPVPASPSSANQLASWPVQDAKARFSELLDTCIQQGPQIVTKRGEQAAVLVPMSEWRRLQAAARPSIKDLLLSDTARGDLELPARGQRARRAPVAAD